MASLIEALPERISDILDERVFVFAQAAQRHFQTNDLVVVLDFRDDVPGLEAVPRPALAAADELSLEIRLKLASPPSNLAEVLGSPEQCFWFLVIYEDEDADCGAVSPSMLRLGG